MSFKSHFRRIYAAERTRLRNSDFADRNLESRDLLIAVLESDLDLGDVEKIRELAARNHNEPDGDILARSKSYLLPF